MKNEKYQAPLNIYISSSYDDAELAQKFLSDYVKGFGITVDKQRNGDELYVTIDGLDEDIDALVSVYTAQYDEFKKDCKAEPSGWVSPVNFEKSKEDESMKSESNIEDLRDQTISWGTMRSEDLIPKFLGVLKTYAKDKYDEYVNENPEVLDIDGLDDETLGWIVDELFDELDKIAPEGTYFGAHPDDGADYGFWSVEQYESKKNEDAGIKVGDFVTYDVDSDGKDLDANWIVAEVLAVNDDGTLKLQPHDFDVYDEILDASASCCSKLDHFAGFKDARHYYMDGRINVYKGGWEILFTEKELDPKYFEFIGTIDDITEADEVDAYYQDNTSYDIDLKDEIETKTAWAMDAMSFADLSTGFARPVRGSENDESKKSESSKGTSDLGEYAFKAVGWEWDDNAECYYDRDGAMVDDGDSETIRIDPIEYDGHTYSEIEVMGDGTIQIKDTSGDGQDWTDCDTELVRKVYDSVKKLVSKKGKQPGKSTGNHPIRTMYDWAEKLGVCPSFSPSDEFGPFDDEDYYAVDGFCFGDDDNDIDGPMVYGPNDISYYNDGSWGYALADGTIYGDHKDSTFIKSLLNTYKDKGLKATIEFAVESGDEIATKMPDFDKHESKKVEDAGNDWVAYYFCKDPQGLEWAVLPHTVSIIGNVNCVNARGGMESIGKEYVLSKCTPVEDVESSEIWKAVCDGEDRRVVAIDRNDAERVLRAENGLEELKSVVAGKDESKKNEDKIYMDCHGFFDKNGKTYTIIDESPEYNGKVVGRWSKSDWQNIDTDKVILDWRKTHPIKNDESKKNEDTKPMKHGQDCYLFICDDPNYQVSFRGKDGYVYTFFVKSSNEQEAIEDAFYEYGFMHNMQVEGQDYYKGDDPNYVECGSGKYIPKESVLVDPYGEDNGIHIKTYRVPEYLLAAMVNGDTDSLSKEDLKELKAVEKDIRSKKLSGVNPVVDPYGEYWDVDNYGEVLCSATTGKLRTPRVKPSSESKKSEDFDMNQAFFQAKKAITDWAKRQGHKTLEWLYTDGRKSPTSYPSGIWDFEWDTGNGMATAELKVSPYETRTNSWNNSMDFSLKVGTEDKSTFYTSVEDVLYALDTLISKTEIKMEAKKSESLTLKQAELKKMAKYGEAEDITGLSDAEAKELKKSGVELVGISRGTYGMNGALMRGTADGKLYVITSRNSNLFYFV